MGNLCDWKTIREIADKNNLTVIEDSADNAWFKIKWEVIGLFILIGQ